MFKFILSLLVLTSINAQATPLSPETKDKLEKLRASVETWAPMCEGAMALDRKCYQFDMVEYAGYRCATGDLERCQDIKEAQDVDGRFWRAKRLIRKTAGNSFSRDMFMGLMFYFSKTKDVDSFQRWMAYLSTHRHRMCDDADDNRCKLQPSSWAMLGLLSQHLGLKQNLKMRLGRQELPGEMLITALTAPKGFELVLLADNLYFLRSLGINTSWMQRTARIAYHRQPNNPMFKYLAEGSTEELASLLMEACPAEPSRLGDDIFWQRRLERNEKGELIVIRDWGVGRTNIPVNEMADGQDCLVALNLAIRSPL